MKRKPKVPKERNQFAIAVRFRRSGAHGKTRKAERRAAKMTLYKTVDP